MEILHLAHRVDWDRAQRAGRYLISTRGRTLEEVGFIHAALRDQVAGVAEETYADDGFALWVRGGRLRQ